MHDALGNAFVIEVGDLFPKDEILQQCRTTVAGLERILVVVDANALIGGEKLAAAVFGVFCEVIQFRIIGPVSGVRRQLHRCGFRLGRLVLILPLAHFLCLPSLI